jgi:hypothetical protein
MRRRTASTAAAIAVVLALSAAVLSIVAFGRPGPTASATSGALTRAELIRLTRAVRCGLSPVVPAKQLTAFRAVAAVLCEPPVGQRSGAVVRRATGSAIPDLQRTVLARGPSRTTAECFVSLLPRPGLVLVDRSGRQLPVAFPRDSCGQPDLVVGTALTRRAWIRLPG